MKKSAFSAALLATATVLAGCPLYDDHHDGCVHDADCASGDACDLTTGACRPTVIACDEPNDCGTNETCSRAGICRTGDCHFESVGCVDGYECSADGGIWHCAPDDSTDGGAGGAGGADGNSGGAPVSAGQGGST